MSAVRLLRNDLGFEASRHSMPHLFEIAVSARDGYIKRKTNRQSVNSLIFNEKFIRDLKKIGPGCDFTYRSRYDPLTDEEMEFLAKMKNECKENG